MNSVQIQVNKSGHEPKEILNLIALYEYIHGSIYVEAFHFMRDLVVIGIVREKSISIEGRPFPLKAGGVLRQPLKLFCPIIEWDSPERGCSSNLIGFTAIELLFQHF